MSDDRLRELYAAGRTAGAEHPAPEAIHALVRREGPEDARLATLDHVMACEECHREFDLLRAIEQAETERVAAARPGARRAWLVPVALAASLLLAVGIGRSVLRPDGEDTTRGAADDVVLVQPGREASAGDALSFTWRAVAGASGYELEVLDAGGGVAASASTTDTTASPLSAKALPAGDYRWWVRAATTDARALRSALRPLRLVAR